jgi:DNA-binding phage protein
MSRGSFDADEVLALLQQAVRNAGGQSEWARIAAVDRTILNQVLRRRRRLTKPIVAALGLQVIESPTAAEVVKHLLGEVEKAGSQTECARRTGLNRSYLTHVLNGRRPGGDILKAFNLTKTVRYILKAEQ